MKSMKFFKVATVALGIMLSSLGYTQSDELKRKFSEVVDLIELKNYDLAEKKLKELDQKNYAKAQFILGVIYVDQNNEGIGKRDIKKALHYYEKAANQGYIPAQVELARIYGLGLTGIKPSIKIKKDLNKAIYWGKKAAEQGSADGMVFLGSRYFSGQGVPMDVEKAIYWYEEAANKGHVGGLDMLIRIYSGRLGQEQKKNVKKMIYWLEKGAVSDNGMSTLNAYRLGQLYHEGKEVPKDKKKAEFWIKQACSKSNEFELCKQYK